MFRDWRNEITLKWVQAKIGETYEVQEYLKSGGLAKIYKIRHRELGEVRVLKIMDFAYLWTVFEKKGVDNIAREFEKIKKRFITEANAYPRLTHPKIVEIFEIGFVKNEPGDIDVPYLIMEYIEGKTIGDRLKEISSLDIKTIFTIAEDVLSLLDTIHQEGIIHRDIKPSNIMLTESGHGVVLLDFGLAKDIENNPEITDSHTSMGTLGYTSPEMLDDSKTACLKTDIFSFGIVLYEMITGERPFKGNYPKALLGKRSPDISFPASLFPGNPEFAAALERVLKKALARKPANRYESAWDFWAALKKLDKNLEKITIQRSMHNEESNQTEIAPAVHPKKSNKVSGNDRPAVFIVEPKSGSLVNGVVTLKAEAASVNGIEKVVFYIAGENIGANSSAPYRMELNTASYSRGPCIIKAEAHDNKGKVAAHRVTVTVSR